MKLRHVLLLGVGVVGLGVACSRKAGGPPSVFVGSEQPADDEADDAAPGDPDGAGGFTFDPDAGANDGAPDGSCGATEVGATAQPANVLLVIDTSGSMLDVPGDAGPSKWASLKAALPAALGAADPTVAFGLETFPVLPPPAAGVATDYCAMPSSPTLTVPMARGNGASIGKALDAITPNGGTPTAAALAEALAYFESPAGKALVGPRYVLLATDGGPDCSAGITCDAGACTQNIDGLCGYAPNCCDGDAGSPSALACLDGDGTTKAVSALAAAGIRTFVVGVPGTEAYATWLEAFAKAGGAPSVGTAHAYYEVTAAAGVAGFQSVLRSITTSILSSCRLQLQIAPPDLDLLNVKVDGALVPPGKDGWALDRTTTPPTVTLQGATCTKVKAGGARSASILYGCPTATIQ